MTCTSYKTYILFPVTAELIILTSEYKQIKLLEMSNRDREQIL